MAAAVSRPMLGIQWLWVSSVSWIEDRSYPTCFDGAGIGGSPPRHTF
jgi:hypothetical protein